MIFRLELTKTQHRLWDKDLTKLALLKFQVLMTCLTTLFISSSNTLDSILWNTQADMKVMNAKALGALIIYMVSSNLSKFANEILGVYFLNK